MCGDGLITRDKLIDNYAKWALRLDKRWSGIAFIEAKPK